MIKFLESLGMKLEPLAIRLGANKTLAAIKDGFIALMPLLIVGSFAIVLNNVLLNWGEGSLFYSFGIRVSPEFIAQCNNLKGIGVAIWQGTLASMALMASFSIAYSYTRAQNKDGLSSGLIALGAFLAMLAWKVSESEAFGINPNDIGSTNIISAIVIAIISAKIYCLCIDKKLFIKMPEGVPPGVMKSFVALIPSAIIITLFAVIAYLFTLFNTSFSTVMTMIISTPLQQMGAKGPALAYLYVSLSNLLYFFGIHGANVLAFMDAAVFTPASITNADTIASGGISTLIFSKGMFDSFVFLGGGGATLGLIIAILIAGKRKADQTIAKFALTPAIFNINEPLVFGLPIVMNPILFIPFVCSPAILLTTAWLQITLLQTLGLATNVGAVLIPWVAPVGIGALLSLQNIFMVIVAFVQLAIATIIYLPFVFAMNYQKDGGEDNA